MLNETRSTFSRAVLRTTVILLSLPGALPAHAEPMSIDEFTAPGTASTVKSTGGSQKPWSDTGLTATDTLGGIRDGSIGCEGVNTSSVTAIVGAGAISLDATGGSTPSLYLGYDGHSGWGSHLETQPFNGVLSSPVDLTGGGGNDAIALRFTSVRSRGVGFNDFRITLVQGYAGDVNTSPGTIAYDADGTPTAGTADYWFSFNAASAINAQLTDGTGEQTFYFPMSSLVNAAGSTATFNAVQAIQFHGCTEQVAFDYTMDSIQAVPEPTTIAAMVSAGLCLVGFGLYRRRRAQREAASTEDDPADAPYFE